MDSFEALDIVAGIMLMMSPEIEAFSHRDFYEYHRSKNKSNL